MQGISLSADDLMLRHDIKLDNKHNFKLVFWWNKLFRIQHTKPMKDTYFLKEINKTRIKRIYADNELKQFKTRNAEDSSTKHWQIAIYEMLNIWFKNSINAMKNSNTVNKDIRITNEVWNEIVWNTECGQSDLRKYNCKR